VTIRVLWAIKGLGPGGAERLLVEHARIADHERFSYEVAYVLDWKRHLVPELEQLGVVTHCLGVRTEVDPRWTTRLFTLLRHGRYDVVHMHSPTVASVARIEACALGPRRPALVYTEHNRWPSYRAETRGANRLTFGLDDATFAVSADVRDSLAARHRDAVEVLVHGVDVERVQSFAAEREETRRELGVQPGESLAVTVANLRAGKNYPGLIDAARLLVDRGVPVRFVTAGQGQLADEVAALHRESGLGDRFALLGYRDDTTRLIAAADVFVLASHHEGLPVTVMEALTLGVPVVATAVGGLPEAVTADENGILVPPGDTAALAAAIERAVEPATHARLVAGARATGDRFSNAPAVARVEATYQRLVTEKQRRSDHHRGGGDARRPRAAVSTTHPAANAASDSSSADPADSSKPAPRDT
jgi:glycosyltransferase involved in cell wall biosynthesis